MLCHFLTATGATATIETINSLELDNALLDFYPSLQKNKDKLKKSYNDMSRH